VTRTVLLVALAVVGPACGGEGGNGKAVPDARDAPPPVTAVPPAPKLHELAPGTRSLRLIRTVAVRIGPAKASHRVGTIAGDTRVGWRDAATGPGCNKPWFAIEPYGWVCGEYIEASTKPPSGVELPRLDRDEIVPGIYGKVVEQGTHLYARGKPEAKEMTKVRPLLGSVNVRKYAELTIAGKVYWKISATAEEWLPASAIREHKPSDYQGTRLGDDTGLTLPMAFVWPRGGALKVWTRGAAKGGGVKRQLSQRDPVPVLEEHVVDGNVTAYRIGDAEWIDASAVRLAKPAPLPAGVKPGDRWLDVDLDSQILVAYEGDLPVYATMVSTGKKDTPTETGIYRVWSKRSESDMKGLTGEDPYSVATVPWTQFYSPERGLALHTSYWHDKFGTQRSHGCTNLSPQDARWLYFFTDPQVPPGWSMAAGAVEAPGSIVRVRSAADPDPPVRGYASKIDAAGDEPE
jgi:hypothetical protein